LPEHFENRPERKRDHFIYASSPDRGLIRLLELWPRVLEKYPEATLDVFYGWRGCAKLGTGVGTSEQWIRRHEIMRKNYEKVRYQKGVTERGMVNHVQIAQEFMRAGVWFYPTDFTETCCTNAIKARSAGCYPVTTDLAALGETANVPQARLVEMGNYDEEYNERILEALFERMESDTSEERNEMSKNALENHNIDLAVAFWKGLIDA